MATVKQVLRTKADDKVHTIAPDARVFDAIALMSKAGVGAIVVTSNGEMDGMVCGIFTERDYARKVILQDKSSRTTTVREIMTAPVMSASLAACSDDCMSLMTQHRIRHLPVIEGGRLLGLISIGDLVRHLIDEQRFAIDQLELYVRGPHERMLADTLTRRSPLPRAVAGTAA